MLETASTSETHKQLLGHTNNLTLHTRLIIVIKSHKVHITTKQYKTEQHFQDNSWKHQV